MKIVKKYFHKNLNTIIFLSFIMITINLNFLQAQDLAKKIKSFTSSKHFTDLFALIGNVEIKFNDQNKIYVITDIAFDNNNNIIIADGWQAKNVIVFDSCGNYIRKIGKLGNGPSGDYLTPVSVTLNSKNEYFVLDYLKRRVLIYDQKGNYLKNFKCNYIGHYIRLNKEDEIFLYSGSSRNTDTIHKYDKNGNYLKSFAPFPSEIKDVNFYTSRNGILIDENSYIYEMNPLYYNVRKFSQSGELIKIFSRKSEFYTQIKQYEPEIGKAHPIILNGPYYLTFGLILVDIDGYLDIYDVNGNFVICGLQLPGKILAVKRSQLYITSEEKNENSILKISRYQLKL